jgi:hypothetical protein
VSADLHQCREVEWVNEHLCRFAETKEEIALRSLARQYHERTEAFDQTHCRARNRYGAAIPIGPEVRECTAFALEQRRQLGLHAAYLGFDAQTWNEAIGSEARHFEADWVNGRYQDDPRFTSARWVSDLASAT